MDPNKDSLIPEGLPDLLRYLESQNPLIPDDLTRHFLQQAGCSCPQDPVMRLVSIAAHKFISEVVSDALQYSKIRQASNAKEAAKLRAVRDRRLILTTEDLSSALKEYGVRVEKPEYFVDS